MKKLIPVLVVTAFASSFANADNIYGGFAHGNTDLYPESAGKSYNSLPIAVQPGTGDSYGGSLFNGTHLQGLIKKGSSNNSPDDFNRQVYGEWAVGNPDL